MSTGLKPLLLEYELPPERIAQFPAGLDGERSASRLLRVHPPARDCLLEDLPFTALPELLAPGDLVVLNDTKVVPGRFLLSATAIAPEVELLLLREQSAAGEADCEKRSRWEAIGRPLRKLRPGLELELSATLRAAVVERLDERRLLLELHATGGGTLREEIERAGGMPIPPYIRGGRSEPCDRELYQTVFAQHAGSAAAPTAGLHFTPAIFEVFRRRGIHTAYVTLHVGPASFLPITAEDFTEHEMIEEHYSIPDETAASIARAKEERRRVVCVGTTTVRALESAALSGCQNGATSLFITPGFTFQIADCMVTNFHQPRSTHLLLVAAFAGEECIERGYRHALAHGYRFLSYGDAMFLERC